jgi:hypothetical protein
VATAASTPRRATAPRSQVRAAATAAPAADIRARAPASASTEPRAPDQAVWSVGVTSRAAAPATSARTGMSLATTGTPAAMASSTGSP